MHFKKPPKNSIRRILSHTQQVSIIGVDLDGNFFLRHSGGAVLYWDHRLQTDTVVASSVREFVERIE
jgi:hypothetical protein